MYTLKIISADIIKKTSLSNPDHKINKIQTHTIIPEIHFFVRGNASTSSDKDLTVCYIVGV